MKLAPPIRLATRRASALALLACSLGFITVAFTAHSSGDAKPEDARQRPSRDVDLPAASNSGGSTVTPPIQAGGMRDASGKEDHPMSNTPDPCAPRDFCGRIAIIFNGAGERQAHQSPYEAIDTNAVLKAFVGDSSVLVPSLLFSSDPAVREGKRAKALSRTNALFVADSSRPSFEKALGSHGYLAAIKQRLENDPKCRSLIKSDEDVSKYLKIEVIVTSHSKRTRNDFGSQGGFEGLPIWEKDGKRGTDIEHYMDSGAHLTPKDFQPLYSLFPNAVVQSLILSCDSANVGEMISPAPSSSPTASCYCYAGLVGKDLLAPAQPDIPKDPISDSRSCIATHLANHSVDGRWQGAANLDEVNLSTVDYYRTHARGTTGRYVDSLYGTSPSSMKALRCFEWVEGGRS